MTNNELRVTKEAIQAKLDRLPEQPGVYLMNNGRGEILYIGKALVLADRVRTRREATIRPRRS